MHYDKLKLAAWVLDIGFFGPRLFEQYASALLESMKHRCLAVEGENDT